MRRIEMNSKNLVNLITRDRELMRLFSGMVLSVAIMASLAITAGVWYL